MSAATTAAPHHKQGISTLQLPVRAAVKLYDGSMASVLVATANAGHVVPAASVATAQRVLGLVRVPYDGTSLVDNTDGANGDLNVNIETEPAWVANGGSIAADDVGALCYATDDSTVDLTGTHVAGMILGVDATNGVLVGFLHKNLFVGTAVADTTTNGAASGAADLAALKTETEAIGDTLRAALTALKLQGTLS